jgi:hypothetical protein
MHGDCSVGDGNRELSMWDFEEEDGLFKFTEFGLLVQRKLD